MSLPCLLWKRAVNSSGYPVLWARKRTMYAHRLMYENKVGLIPAGYAVVRLPSCSRLCIRPEHLSLLPSVQQHEKAGKARWS